MNDALAVGKGFKQERLRLYCGSSAQDPEGPLIPGGQMMFRKPTTSIASIYVLIIALFAPPGSEALSEPANSLSIQSASETSTQSDDAAIAALQSVLAKSGGAALWQAIHSAQETFEVQSVSGGSSKTHVLLDDWSLDRARYRRGVKGQHFTPREHDGAASVPVTIGSFEFQAPEVDPARIIVSHLPAAAAEVLLRRKEYILKEGKNCAEGAVCVDVFRAGGGSRPEQQWRIAAATGLPVSVRIAVDNIRNETRPLWRSVFYMTYETVSDVLIPNQVKMYNTSGKIETWTLVSIKCNPEFDTLRFDQELAR